MLEIEDNPKEKTSLNTQEETDVLEKHEVLKKSNFLRETMETDTPNQENNINLSQENIESNTVRNEINNTTEKTSEIIETDKNTVTCDTNITESTSTTIITNSPSKSSEIQNELSENQSVSEKIRKSSTKTRKRLAVIDESDSDSEDTKRTINEKENVDLVLQERVNFSDNDSENSSAPLKSKKHTTIFDSDSESDGNDENPTDLKNIKKNRIADSDSEPENNVDHVAEIKNNRKNLFDSDSESEVALNKKTAPRVKEAPVYDVNSKGELVPETNISSIKKSSFSNLFDSESSDDELVANKKSENEENEYDSESEHIKPIPYKKKPNKKKGEEEQPKKMTAKEAAKLRNEVKSESQRMLRESNICLPYHKPKSHSLKDFLSRRPKLASAVPVSSKMPASVAIKMSTEQLKIVSQKLKERKKDLKEFYKSETESESDDNDDDDKDYIPPEETNKNTEEVTPNDLNTMTDEDPKDNNKSPQNNEQSSNINDTEAEKIDEYSEILGDNEHLKLCEEIPMEVHHAEELQIKEVEDGLKNKELEEEYSEKPEDLNKDNASFPEAKDTLESSDSITKENVTELTNVDVDDNTSLNKDNECHQQEPMDFDFNLDDIQENTEKDVPSNSLKNIDKQIERTKVPEEMLEINIQSSSNEESCASKQFEYTDLDKEIENFGEPENKPNKKASKLALLKQQLSNSTPRLSGGPNDVIDLDTGITKTSEVTKLMQRFINHTSVKKHTHKNKVKLNIVTVESSGSIFEETVAMNIEEDETKVVVEEKPGEKLKKLREELEKQMVEEKAKIWKEKASKGIISNENKDEDIEYEDDFNDVLDDEEEAEMTDNEETEDEEELLENDVDLSDKPKTKSAFLDEEAEESETEEKELEGKGDGINDEGEDNDGAEVEEESSDDEDKEEIDEPKSLSDKKKNLKRIIKAFEDSDDDDMFPGNDTFATPNKTSNGATHLDTTETADDDDMFIPPHQLPLIKTPVRQVTPTRSHFDISTPLSFMSGLQNLNTSAQKESPITSNALKASDIIGEPAPTEDTSISSVQKKLFSEPTFEIQEEQLELICSGKFPSTQEVLNSEKKDNKSQTTTTEKEESKEKSAGSDDNIETLNKCSTEAPSVSQVVSENDQPTTQDLLNICSGQFTGFTAAYNKENGEDVGKTDSNQKIMTQSSEVKALDEDEDFIISQLIDEEELESFKRKFDSPVVKPNLKTVNLENVEEIQGGGRIDSDEENEDDDVEKSLKKKKKKNKNQRKIVFSDSDSSDDEYQKEAEEKIDLNDSCADEEEDVENIGYDSEENEIDIAEDGPKEKLKTADFFEAEAELSESEWGSADEDEKDLDKLEFELGDTEKFDENKVREDLEKIHMRRMLDDDTHEVKLLQEMLLDDGELHGTGRQRQFKWKNIDSIGGDEDGTNKKDDDDVYMDEEESEEQWRKRRHEREMFLKEKLKKVNSDSQDDGVFSSSQLLKLGQKVLQRSQSQPNSQNTTPAEKVVNPDVVSKPIKYQHPLTLMNKRGSFLSRGDQVLQKLAEYTKVTTVVGTATAKNSKSFLFQTVSATETSISFQNKKRKAGEGTPNVIKKLRLSGSDLSPANKKTVTKNDRVKKLFSNV